MGSTATASTTNVTEPTEPAPTATANHWHLAGIIAAPSLGALILNGIGFFNMLAALETSSLGDTGAHWILAGGLEFGIVGFALAAFCLSLLNRPSKAAEVFTLGLSLVSATIGYTHVVSTGDEIAVRVFVAAAPILAAGAWHWTLKGVKSVLIDDDLEQKAEAAMMRAAIAARMDHARLDELAKTSAGPAKWIADARLANAASRSYRTQKAVALGVAPHRQRAVSETFVSGAVSVAAVLAEVRPIDVSVPALTQALTPAALTGERSTAHSSAQPSGNTERSTAHHTAQTLTPEALTDERSAAQPTAVSAADATSSSAQRSGDVERSTAHPVAHQEGSMSGHEDAHRSDHSGEGLQAQPSAHDEVGARDERSTAQPTPVVAATEASSSSAHGKRAVSARGLEAAHGERSADATKALTSAQPASRLRAVPSTPTVVPAGPGRDAIVDEMLASDEKVTGGQVAKRLGLAEQSGRRELKAARDRAAAARASAVNQ